jgi:hypothetical protein
MFNRWPTFQRAVYLGQLEINTSTQRLPSAEIPTLTDHLLLGTFVPIQTETIRLAAGQGASVRTWRSCQRQDADLTSCSMNTSRSRLPGRQRGRQSYHRDLVWILRQILWCSCPHVSPVIEICGCAKLDLFFDPEFIPALPFSKNTYRYGMFLGAGVAQAVYCLTTDWTNGWSGFDPRQGQRIFPLASVSRPALRPTQPPVQWYWRSFLKAKRGRGVTLTTHPF